MVQRSSTSGVIRIGILTLESSPAGVIIGANAAIENGRLKITGLGAFGFSGTALPYLGYYLPTYAGKEEYFGDSLITPIGSKTVQKQNLSDEITKLINSIDNKVDKTRTPNVDIHYGTSVKPVITKVTENDAEINSASGSGFGVIFDLAVDYDSLVGNYFHRSNSVGLGRTYLEIVSGSAGGNNEAGTLVLKWGDNADTLTFPSDSILRRATPGKLLSAAEYTEVRKLAKSTAWFVYEKETDTQEASLLIELKEAYHGNTKVVRYIEKDISTQVKRIFDVEIPNTDDKVDKSEVEMPLLYGKSKRAPAKHVSFKGASLSHASGEESLTLHFNGSQNLSRVIGDYLYNPKVLGLGTKFIKLKSIVSGNNTSAVKVTLSWDENADTSLIENSDILKASNPGTDFSEAEYQVLAFFSGTRTNANKTQLSNTWSIYEDVAGEEEADLTWDFKSHVERNEAGEAANTVARFTITNVQTGVSVLRDFVLPRGATGGGGTQGPQGEQGSVGPQGPLGLAGPKGITGAQGDAGPAGADGQDGADGPKGDKGDPGSGGGSGSGVPVSSIDDNFFYGKIKSEVTKISTDTVEIKW